MAHLLRQTQGREAFFSLAPSSGGAPMDSFWLVGAHPLHTCPHRPASWQVSSRQAAAGAVGRCSGIRAFYKHRSFRPLWPLMLGLWVAVGTLPPRFPVGTALLGCSSRQSRGQGPGCCSKGSRDRLPKAIPYPVPRKLVSEVGSSLGQFTRPPKLPGSHQDSGFLAR